MQQMVMATSRTPTMSLVEMQEGLLSKTLKKASTAVVLEAWHFPFLPHESRRKLPPQLHCFLYQSSLTFAANKKTVYSRNKEGSNRKSHYRGLRGSEPKKSETERDLPPERMICRDSSVARRTQTASKTRTHMH